VKELRETVRSALLRFRQSPEAPRNQKKRKWKTIYVSLGFLIPLLLGVGFWMSRSMDDGITSVPYSVLAATIENGNAKILVVERSGGLIIATLRRPLLVEGAESDEIKAFVPRDVLTLEDLERWAERGSEVRVEESRDGALGPLPFVSILLLGAFIFILLKSQGIIGQGRRFAVTPSERRLTLADVGGASEARADLLDVISYLKDPTVYHALGAVCPKGVLLVGSPGTGKTLLARAVAGESGRPVIIASGSEFSEMYVGVGARRIRDLARQARNAAPCIIFIDEFESLGRRRGNGNRSSEEENTLNQLLVEMDGTSGNEGVVWMAATNREDLLDPAVRRPGRFDRVVEVSLPNSRDRLQILRIHAARKPMAADVDLERLSALTINYSGADLANLLNEAAIAAAQDGSTEIANRHVEFARDKVMLGRLRSGVSVSDHERRLIAVHEAGHAIVGLVACPEDRLHKVTIEARGRSLGAAHFAPDADRHLYSRAYLEGTIAKALGGRAAELVFFGPEAVTSGAGSDLIHATRIARRMVGEFGMSDEVGLYSTDPAANDGATSAQLQGQVDNAARGLIAIQAERAEELIRAYQPAVAALADALLERNVLSASEVIELAVRNDLPIDSPLLEVAAPRKA
jgi:cell division protease FtsH